MIRMARMLRTALLVALMGAPLALAQSPPPAVQSILPGSGQDADDIVVRLRKVGEAFVVDVDMPVLASSQTVWEVLTDYEHMARFMGNVQSSRVTERRGNVLTIAQRSGTWIGLLKMTFENVRQVELVPGREIRSRVISGDMKDSAYITRLVSEGEGATRVVNHGEFMPTMWVPPVIGEAYIASETRRQFAELRKEILRRAAASSAAPAVQ